MAEGSSSQLRDEIEDGGEQAAIEERLKHLSTLKSVKQYCMICPAEDKFLHILALLKKTSVRKKVLIFTNRNAIGKKLTLFLKRNAMNVALLVPDSLLAQRIGLLRDFNAGSIDYLVAIYQGEADVKKQEVAGENAVDRFKRQLKQLLDVQFGIVRGSELQDVKTVINFDMPLTAAGYMHRIGRTGRVSDTPKSVSLVSSVEIQAFEELKSTLAAYRDRDGDGEFIFPFPSLTEDEVESLRYRSEDIERTLTLSDARADLDTEPLEVERRKKIKLRM